MGLLVTNPAFVSKDGTAAEMQGVGVEIGRELAKHLNAAFEPVRYKTLAPLLDGARNGEWDVTMIGYSPERTANMDFTGLVTIGGARYAVPTGSPIRSVADIDKPGHRVTVIARSVQDTYLTGNLKRAEVVRIKEVSEAFELLKAGKAHAHFGAELGMIEQVAKRPEYRLVEGSVRVGGNALAIPKGRPAGTAYAKEFIEYAKASGLVQQAIERNELKGMDVAPAGATH